NRRTLPTVNAGPPNATTPTTIRPTTLSYSDGIATPTASNAATTNMTMIAASNRERYRLSFIAKTVYCELYLNGGSAGEIVAGGTIGIVFGPSTSSFSGLFGGRSVGNGIGNGHRIILSINSSMTSMNNCSPASAA